MKKNIFFILTIILYICTVLLFFKSTVSPEVFPLNWCFIIIGIFAWFLYSSYNLKSRIGFFIGLILIPLPQLLNFLGLNFFLDGMPYFGISIIGGECIRYFLNLKFPNTNKVLKFLITFITCVIILWLMFFIGPDTIESIIYKK